MEILDFSKGQIWGIIPDKFESVARKFFELNLNLDQKQFEAFLNSGRGGEEKPYRITDGGSAIIPITGPLSKRMSFISWLMGGSTYGQIASMFKMAINDDEVNSIILDIDSPGGTVAGTEGVGDLVFNSKGEKPIIAYTSGIMASAAYWIGSAAEAVIADKTAQVGSIGVLMIHRDYSKWDQEQGIKTTYITAGKYKALGNPDEPLSKDAKEYFQAEVDYIYSIFVDTVARNREVGTDKVLTDMADGRIFTGQRAVDAGLVDHIGNFDSALEMAGSLINDNSIHFLGGNQMDKGKQEIKSIDSLTAAFPELVQQIQDSAVNSAKAKIEGEAKKAEQGRILELIQIQFDGDQAAKLKSVIEAGVSPEQFRAIKDLDPKSTADGESAEDKELKQKMLDAITKAGAENPGSGGQDTGQKDYMVLVEEFMAANNVPRLKAMQVINRTHPKAREEFIRKHNPHMAKTG